MSKVKEPATEPIDTGHDYDGIREYDNVLPNWWLATLYATIVFSFGYWMYYHVLGTGPLQMDEYHAEMAQAEEAAAAAAAARGALGDDELLAMVADSAKVEDGKSTFATYCVACHGMSGEGGIGPNLTDAYWIHGSKPTEILNVIRDGVPSKGMAAWGPVLGSDKVEKLTAFVVTLKGKDVPGKAAEGELASE